MNAGIYAGTFDPITLGHLDLIERAACIFDRVIVAVAIQTGKESLFSVEEREALVREVVGGMSHVEVVSFDGLLVEYARREKVNVLIRGLRAFSDFEYELQVCLTNRKLASDIETLYLMPSENYSFISSTRVREVARLQADTSPFVPLPVVRALEAKYVSS